MRVQTVRAFVFIAILSILAADLSVGCGSQAYVYGPVTQKFATGTDEVDRMIEIGGTTYLVPPIFFAQIEVGDIVKYNGRIWTIVRKAGAPAPASPSP